jgi:hypothetical protein
MLGNIRDYFATVEGDYIPQLSLNCVILAYHQRKLQVVVNEVSLGKNTLLAIPGGYVHQKEDLTEAVQRIVRESTGLEDVLFRQFAIFGKASRSFAEELSTMMDLESVSDQLLFNWISKRHVSLGYIALVDYSTIELKPIEFYDSARWLTVDQAGKLIMDHEDMLCSAMEFLRKEMPYTPVASNLLPSRFTLPELLALVESILDRKIDRPNFRRKILSTGLLKKVGLDNSGKRRPADLYSFKYGKDTTLMDDVKLGF